MANQVSNQQKRKSTSTLCFIHYSQPANEVGTVGAINYRWEKVGGREGEMKGIERGLACSGASARLWTPQWHSENWRHTVTQVMDCRGPQSCLECDCTFFTTLALISCQIDNLRQFSCVHICVMAHSSATVIAKLLWVFSEKPSNIHNIPAIGYSLFWNQDIKLAQMQHCSFNTRTQSRKLITQALCISYYFL